jgi:hypothetical protein
VTLDELKSWSAANGGHPVVLTSALTGAGVRDAFMQLGERGSKQSMSGVDSVAMPSSLSGAAGAIKLDATADRAATEAQQKKKKKCGC